MPNPRQPGHKILWSTASAKEPARKSARRKLSGIEKQYAFRLAGIFSRVQGIQGKDAKNIAAEFYRRLSHRARKPNIRTWIRLGKILVEEKAKMAQGTAMKSNAQIIRETGSNANAVRKFFEKMLTKRETQKRERLVEAGKRKVSTKKLIAEKTKEKVTKLLIEQGLIPASIARLLVLILEKGAAPSDNYVKRIARDYEIQRRPRMNNQELATALKKMLGGRGKRKQIVEFLEKYRAQI